MNDPKTTRPMKPEGAPAQKHVLEAGQAYHGGKPWFSIAVEGNLLYFEARLRGHAIFRKEIELPPEIAAQIQGLDVVVPIFIDTVSPGEVDSEELEISTQTASAVVPEQETNSSDDHIRVIDLGDACRSKEDKILNGRDWGRHWRKQYALEQLDRTPERVRVVIPDDIISINWSFFRGLFGDSVRLLGRTTFRKKYEFECDSSLDSLIEQGIEQSLLFRETSQGPLPAQHP